MKALLLAGGYGTRLRPLTDFLPKCLMPIKGYPLLEYWLQNVNDLDLEGVLINLHYLSEQVESYIENSTYKESVKTTFEKELLGTAGTLKRHMDYFYGETTLVIHADNFCISNLAKFIEYHYNQRPTETVMTMMTFKTDDPKNCGIVETNKDGVVLNFHEKVKNPPSNNANAAVYLIENEVLDFIRNINSETIDFSTEVISHFLGKIAVWSNEGVHVDIGTLENLKKVQEIKFENTLEININSSWYKLYKENPVNNYL